MALTWDWKDKIGELLIQQGEKQFTISIYKGNALAIFLDEYKNEKGQDVYSMYNFFCDKEHFKNCTKEFCPECGRRLSEYGAEGDILQNRFPHGRKEN